MKKNILCLILVGLFIVGCSKYVKIQTYEFDINETVTKEQVKDAILTGCKGRHWTTEEKDENTISARLISRSKYKVYIDIVYDASGYKIEYVDSVNLNATEDKIDSE